MTTRSTRVLSVLASVAALAAAPAPVNAVPLTWSGTIDTIGVSGEVEFQVVGGDLWITLKNTATVKPTSTKQILTGLLFDITGYSGALGMLSATANDGIVNAGSATPGSAPLNICAPGIGGTALVNACSSTLGGGWEAGYFAGGATSDFTQHYGIGTAGLGLFNGNPTTGVGDANYGLVSTLGTTILDGLTGMQPYSYQRATFVLYGGADLLDTISISKVQALYGTTLDDIRFPNVVPPAGQGSVPEPGSLALLGLGLAGLGLVRRHKAA
jgi:hypothetical protein